MEAVNFTNDAKLKLTSYNIPGNVRELKDIANLACIMGDGIDIKA